jgi:hypothetical protein
MKAKRIFTFLALLLGFFTLLALPAREETAIVRAQEPDGDVGVAAAADTFIDILAPLPPGGLPLNINVDVGDTVNIPVQIDTLLSVPPGDTVNFVELSFILPPSDVIQVLDVVSVQSQFATALSNKNIFGNTVSFRIDFLSGVPFGTAPVTIANLRVKVLKTSATPAELTLNGTSRIGWTALGGGPQNAEFIVLPGNYFINQGTLTLAPDTVNVPNDSIPFNILYPEMIVYIDERLTTPPNYDIKVGETVETEIRMSEVAGVTRIVIDLAEDPSIVELLDVTPGSQFTLVSFDPATNEIELESATGNPVFVASDTTLATLNWEGIAPGSLSQVFELVELFDADDVQITNRAPVLQNGGTITVEDQDIRIFLEPSSLTIPAVGQTGIQIVKTEGVFNVGRLDFILTFDESVVEVDSLQVSTLYSGATAGVIGNSINFSYVGPRISEDGDVLIITWRGVGPGTNKDISFTRVTWSLRLRVATLFRQRLNVVRSPLAAARP